MPHFEIDSSKEKEVKWESGAIVNHCVVVATSSSRMSNRICEAYSVEIKASLFREDEGCIDRSTSAHPSVPSIERNEGDDSFTTSKPTGTEQDRSSFIFSLVHLKSNPMRFEG